MPTRPTSDITFGTTGLTAEPILAKKQEGWLTGKRLPARWLNWFMNAYYNWITYIDGMLGLDSHLTASIAGDATASRSTLTLTAAANGRAGLTTTGGPTAGAGIVVTGGSSSGFGIQATGGTTNGSGIDSAGTGSGYGMSARGGASGTGVLGEAGATGNTGLQGFGPTTGRGGTGVTATGTGVHGVGSVAAAGVEGRGGTTAGPGGRFTGGTGDGVGVIATGDGTTTGVNGVTATGGLAGSGVAGTGGANSGNGVLGTGGSSNGIGVKGQGTGSGTGVSGIGGASSGAIGVSGTGGSTNGVGMSGTGVGTGDGVAGTSVDSGATGSGVRATNISGGYALKIKPDTTSPVRAAVQWDPQDAQPTGAHLVGDSYMTAAGDIVVCTVAGTPGTWRRVGRLGTPTNDNATTGDIGELLGPISRLRSNATSLTTATGVNVGTTTNIVLTAGDWDIRGAVGFTFAASTSVTALDAAISKTSATRPANDTLGVPTAGEFRMAFDCAAMVPGSGSDVVLTIPTYRVSVSANTTFYLVALASFTVSTCSAYGWMEARRVR